MTIIMRKILIMSIMLTGCLLSGISCSEETEYDVYGSTEKKVFINEGLRDGKRNNLGSCTITHTVAGSYADKTVQVAFPVRLSGTADGDVKVTLSAGDATLTDMFNGKFGTSYASANLDWQFGVLDSVKVDGSYAIDTDRAILTIPAGASQSRDSIALYIPEASCTDLHEEAYLIPISIQSVEGAEAGIAENEDLTYSFVIIGTQVDNNLIKQVSSPDEIDGIQLEDRSGMSATLESSGSFSGSSAKLFDGNTRTYWYSWTQSPAKFVWDLGAEYQNITGMSLYGRYCYPKEITIQYSHDGSTWADLAEFDSADNSYYQYYAAYAPFSAKYISMDIQSWGGYYAGFSELYLYVKE